MGNREKYQDLTQEELLDKIEELEGAIVDYKKETKSTKKESSKTIEDLQAQIDELKKGSQKNELEIFLEGKKLSEDERKAFDEKVKKGYDKEDALRLATLGSEKQKANQESIARNELDGEDNIDSKNTITTKQLSELSQEEYNKVRDDIDTGKIQVADSEKD